MTLTESKLQINLEIKKLYIIACKIQKKFVVRLKARIWLKAKMTLRL